MQLFTRNELREAIWQGPDRLSGELCFRGTRVPVRGLFEYLALGAPLSEFSGGVSQHIGVAGRQLTAGGGALADECHRD